jgi:hypothetical protein
VLNLADLRITHLRRTWQTICVVIALTAVLSVLGSCAAHPRYNTMPEDDTLEAQPLSEDESLADKAGEVGVVGLAVGIIVGGILLPIFLL